MPRKPLKKTYVHYLLIFWILASGMPVYSQLKADFTIDKTGGCSPLIVSFTNKTSGASSNAIYTWDFGNGNTSVLTSPGAVYSVPNVYTITLTVKDGSQTSSRSQTVTVYNNPSIDFSASPVKGCLPLPVTFTSNSSPGSGLITSLYWDFGDGSTQQGFSNSQQHTYSDAQITPVSLTVTNSFGCHSTLQKQSIVNIIPALNAGFTADKRVLCLETDNVQFKNASSGPGTLSYLWDFGDGNTSTQKDPLYSFNKKGTYTVKMTVTSSEGCNATSTQTNYLNVANYSSDFTVPPLICSGNSISFGNLSTPSPDNSAWEVDGLPAYYGRDFYFYSFNSPGTHTIKLTNTFGTCVQSVSKSIQVQTTPDSKGFISNIDGLCGAPVNVEFKDTTANAVKWEWNFDWNYTGNLQSSDQAPVHNFTESRPYLVFLKVTNASGCEKDIYKSISITGPTVNINLVSGNTFSCGAEQASFSARSSEQITAYNWDFSDGGTSTDPAPVHTFTATGTFQVKLNYTTINGCKGTAFFNSITIRYMPKVDFTVSATEVCGGANVYFTATPNTQDIIYWTWYYGDGNSSYASGANSIHSYQDSGTYTIGLYVSNGCDTFITKQNLIKVLPPYPRITGILNSCDADRGQVRFVQTTKAASSMIWDFGDGNTLASMADTVTYKYKKSGAYTVTLTAVNNQCSVKTTSPVNVLLKQNPVLSSLQTQVCLNDLWNYTIDHLEPNPDYCCGALFQYYRYKWEFNDGTSFNGYDRVGNYGSNTMTGSLQYIPADKTGIRVITQSLGFACLDTTNYLPIKMKGATAGFTALANNVCYQSPIILKDASTTTPGNAILTWQWNFGDGTTQSLNQGGTVSHTYNDPGNYYLSLSVIDAGGCSAPAFNGYVTIDGPKAAFSASATNVPLNSTVSFYNYSNINNSNNPIFKWDFGDGSTSNAYSPSHTFAQPGTYTVTLQASNPLMQCSSVATQVITVKPFNSAFAFSTSFITNTSCPPVLAQFTNTSVNYTSVKWDFGDGNTADNLNYPSHIYEKPGKYIVTLSVYGPNGLKGQFIDSVIVKQPAATMKADGYEGCIGHTVTLTAMASNSSSYAWDFGDGSIISSTDSFVTHQYMVPGIYEPQIIMKDAGGCTGSADLNNKITIRPNPVVTVNPAQPLICHGSSTALKASGGSIYSWAPASGLNNNVIASPVASPDSTTTYTISIADDLGCKNTGTVTVTVVQPVTVQVTNNTAICAGDPIQLHASGAYSYSWINSTEGLSSTNIADPVGKPTVSTVYTVTGSDAHNCFSDTAQVSIQVWPLPQVDAGPDQMILAGTPVQLHAQGSSNITQWLWSPASYLDCSNCPSPESTPVADITYLLSVKDVNGCMSSDSVSIKMECDADRVRIPNVFTPNHDGKNDVFIIKGISYIKHLLIYNRWGEKVFERNNFIAADRSSCWDGTFKGFPAAEGTYVYFVEMQCSGGSVFTRSGSLILVR